MLIARRYPEREKALGWRLRRSPQSLWLAMPMSSEFMKMMTLKPFPPGSGDSFSSVGRKPSVGLR